MAVPRPATDNVQAAAMVRHPTRPAPATVLPTTHPYSNPFSPIPRQVYLLIQSEFVHGLVLLCSGHQSPARAQQLAGSHVHQLRERYGVRARFTRPSDGSVAICYCFARTDFTPTFFSYIHPRQILVICECRLLPGLARLPRWNVYKDGGDVAVGSPMRAVCSRCVRLGEYRACSSKGHAQTHTPIFYRFIIPICRHILGSGERRVLRDNENVPRWAVCFSRRLKRKGQDVLKLSSRCVVVQTSGVLLAGQM